MNKKYFVEFFCGDYPGDEFTTWGIQFPCDEQGNVSEDLLAEADLSCFNGRVSPVYQY